MSELKLTARTQNRNDRHALIDVFQNGGNAGTLTVARKYEAAVLGAINGHADLLEACRAIVAAFELPAAIRQKVQAAIAKAEGKSV